MTMPYHLQAAATIGVLAAIAFAELAGLALAGDPGSAWLWYLNLSVLASLQPGLQFFSNLVGVDGMALVIGLVALCGLILVAAIARLRLLTSIAANLALILCIGFFMLWQGGKTAEVASLGDFVATSRDGTVLWAMTGLAIVASLSTHAWYLRRAIARG